MRTLLLITALLTAALGCAAQPPLAPNDELARLTAQDQADRQPRPAAIDWDAVAQRDAQRRARVLQLLQGGQVRAADDYFHAALVFQHGDSVEDFRLAHALAVTALRISPAHRGAAWLTAASWDRLMMQLGQPQWYATQFVPRDGRWQLHPVNEQAVADAERVRLTGRTLQEAREFAASLPAPQQAPQQGP